MEPISGPSGLRNCFEQYDDVEDVEPIAGPSGLRNSFEHNDDDLERVGEPSGLQSGGAHSDDEEEDATSDDEDLEENPRASSVNFIEANQRNIPEIDIREIAEGPFEQGQVIYDDENSNLRLKIKKIRHQRETNYLEDHLFEISVNEIQRSQRAPLLISLLMIFRTALIEILNNLAQFYDQNNEHQMYITVIDDTINHGLNTGNYNVRTDPETVTDRILTMLYNFLTSHMSLRLNQSFRFNIKVLSVRHARDRTQRGGFNPHILNGTFSIKKQSICFSYQKALKDMKMFSQKIAFFCQLF